MKYNKAAIQNSAARAKVSFRESLFIFKRRLALHFPADSLKSTRALLCQWILPARRARALPLLPNIQEWGCCSRARRADLLRRRVTSSAINIIPYTRRGTDKMWMSLAPPTAEQRLYGRAFVKDRPSRSRFVICEMGFKVYPKGCPALFNMGFITCICYYCCFKSSSSSSRGTWKMLKNHTFQNVIFL